MLRLLARFGDVFLAIAVVVAVAILIVPLPTAMVDVLLSISIGGSVVLLLTATYVRHPIRFSTLPVILLLATLFRLALNVSTTRLILSQADAGAVVESFGEFVVGGNYVVGAVIFVILTVVQYVVIAKGSERVAEVSARFTLDALPGRQLAIDADLRSGAIDLQEARRQRRALQRESKLYGALDGAMKFVKGDAIAGIVITLVNITAGLAVGVLQQGMSVVDAAHRYTLLTVGDGLVAQIPAILLATAAGVVVTQVASDADEGHLARDIGAQITAHPRALAVTSGLLLVFALLPGLPLAPFALVAVLVGLVAWGARRANSTPDATDERPPRPGGPRLELRVGDGLRAHVDAPGDSDVTEAFAAPIDELTRHYGVYIPPVDWSDESDPTLAAHEARLDLDGVPLVRWYASPGRNDLAALSSQLGEQIVGHLAELLRIQDVSARIEELAAEQPALVDAVLPKLLSLPQLAELLRRLLEQRLPVRSLDQILDVVAREGIDQPELPELVERVRQGLSRQIVHAYADEGGTVRAWLLDAPVEEMIRTGVRKTARGRRLVLDTEITDEILDAIGQLAGDQEPRIILTHADVRPHLQRLLAPRFARVSVLSFEELKSAGRVESVGTVRVGRERGGG